MFFQPLDMAITVLSVVFSLVSQLLTGNFTGKIELAPAYVHLHTSDDTESGKKFDMPGFRGELVIDYGSGMTLRPSFAYYSKNGYLMGTSVICGYRLAFFPCVTLTPLGGINIIRLNSNRSVQQPLVETSEEKSVQRKFRAATGVIGGELSLSLTSRFRLTGQYLYGWARTHTSLKDLLKTKTNSSGAIYTGSIDYFATPRFSINVGCWSDRTLQKEAFGLTLFGLKAGFAFSF